MRFLIDESDEGRIKTFLVSQGHDARRVGSDYPQSLSDVQVLDIARAEQRVLITNDKDFGDLVFGRSLPHAGIILLRFPLESPVQQKIDALSKLLVTHLDQVGRRRFLVVSPAGVRVP